VIDFIKNFMAIRGNDSLSFCDYMGLALYAPGHGYYVSGNEKIGPAGDFITAPELTPWFAQAMAYQFAEIFNRTGLPLNILEFGAGTGKFAIEVMNQLKAQGISIARYVILEVSPFLREKQQEYASQFPEYLERMIWLDRLPAMGTFSGIIFANEVIDAMPVHRFFVNQGELLEQSVQISPKGELEYGNGLPLSEKLKTHLEAIQSRCGPFSEGYLSEVNALQGPWIQSLSESLKEGALMIVDYGYSEQDYYSRGHSSGTLACYHRHQMNTNPLFAPGEQDITAHVDFSSLAEAGISAGFELEGYTSQGLFLANLLSNIGEVDPVSSQHLRRLMHPSAMGEIFKVMGFSKGIEQFSWLGFGGVDQRHQL
jgi:SAM-dependent MidA family methyltransferase